VTEPRGQSNDHHPRGDDRLSPIVKQQMIENRHASRYTPPDAARFSAVTR
jgi:hypothetical protein